MNINLPTLLTWFRIILIPILITVFYLPYVDARMWAAIIFILAAISDLLDGLLARMLNMTSKFGAFLDPVADKLIVMTALILLLDENSTMLFTIATIVIVGREITVSALREWMAEVGRRTHLAVNWLGKLKTVLHMAAIILMLYKGSLYGIQTYPVGVAIFYLSAVITLWSMVHYLSIAAPSMKQ